MIRDGLRHSRAESRREHDQLHSYMEKRFEDHDRRFEAIDGRFEAIDRRFDEIGERDRKRTQALVQGLL